MPTGNRNGKSQFIGTRLPLDLDEQIRECAAANGTTISAIIIAAVREYLEKYWTGGSEE